MKNVLTLFISNNWKSLYLQKSQNKKLKKGKGKKIQYKKKIKKKREAREGGRKQGTKKGKIRRGNELVSYAQLPTRINCNMLELQKETQMIYEWIDLQN